MMERLYYNSDGKKVPFHSVVERRVFLDQRLDKLFLSFPRREAVSINSTRSTDSISPSSVNSEIKRLKHHRIESREKLRRNRLERPKTTINYERRAHTNVESVDEEIVNLKRNKMAEKKSEQKANENSKRQTFGLKVAVADFSQKIIDNLGMNITTFNEPEEDNEENLKPKNVRILSESYSNVYAYKVLSPLDKFRRAIKSINLMLKATMTNAEQSKKHEQKYLTFTDLKSDIEDDDKKPIFTDLSFDLSDYKAKREGKLSLEAINIMKRHQSLRNEDHIHLVIMALNSTVEAFGEFPINMQEAIVRHGWYEKFGPKRVIIRQNHAAQNFYFIISGKTMVVVARKNNTSGESYGETVAFLKKGNSFGELALMYGGKRSASVVCYDEVELLSVSREDFIEIFMNLSTDTEPQHIQFLRTVPILQGWSIDCLPYDDPRICMFTYFRKGTVLCRDSNNSERVYIVCSGICKVIKAMDEVVANGYKVNRNSGNIICRYPSRSLAGKKAKTVYVQISALQSGEVFGLESIAFGQLGFTTSVTFVSDGAECVAIERKFFCDNMTESYMKKLRYEIQPFPIEEELKRKLQNYIEWKTFREAFKSEYKKD